MTNVRGTTAARLCALAGAYAAVALIATSATAQSPTPAQVSIQGDALVVTGDGGVQRTIMVVENDRVSVSPAVAAAGCTTSGFAAICNRGAFARITVDLSGADDTLSIKNTLTNAAEALPGTVALGDGDDKVSAQIAGPAYDAGPGDDIVVIGRAQVAVAGGEGSDSLIVDSAASWFIRLDGLPNDGFAINPDGTPAGNGDIEGDFEAVAGGKGNDVIDGAATGGLRLSGGAGDDVLRGGRGADVLYGEAGSDRISGGGGRDRVSYNRASEDLALSLDGKANDGAPGEGDNLADDIETVEGGRGNDVIRGAKRAVTLLGGPGADRIFGGAARDLLDGGAGDDQIDAVESGAEKADAVRCGSGDDGAKVSRMDKVHRSCEKATRGR